MVQDEQDIVLGIQNRTEKTLQAGAMWGYAQCEWVVNGNKYGSSFALEIPPDAMVIVHFDPIDSVYKELELPDGSPLEVCLAVPVPGTELSGGQENTITINCSRGSQGRFSLTKRRKPAAASGSGPLTVPASSGGRPSALRMIPKGRAASLFSMQE